MLEIDKCFGDVLSIGKLDATVCLTKKNVGQERGNGRDTFRLCNARNCARVPSVKSITSVESIGPICSIITKIMGQSLEFMATHDASPIMHCLMSVRRR